MYIYIYIYVIKKYITVRLKGLNLINKIVFQLRFDNVSCDLVIHH